MPNWLTERSAALWLRLSMRGKGRVLISIPLLGIFLALAALAYLQRSLEESERWVLHTQEVRLKTQELRTLMIDGQSAVRGYALTGDQRFLAAYETAVRRVMPALSELGALVSDDWQQTRRVGELEPLVRERMIQLKVVRELVGEQQPHKGAVTATSQIVTEVSRGKVIMDACRQKMAELEAHEGLLLDRRLSRLRAHQQWTWFILPLSTALVLAGGWAAAGLFGSGVAARLGALGESARRLARREPLPPAVAGADEIHELDVELHRTADLVTTSDRQLRISEERFRTLINASTQILWTTDADGLVVDDLPTWRAYSGQTVEQVRGWGWLESVHPEDRERTASAWARAVAERGPYEVTYRIRRHDGIYGHFAVRGVPLLENGEVREWIGGCTDVSSRVEVDRMKDEFVSTVSHELRTPLASLRGFTELMLTREFPEEKRREFLGIIHRESKRLANLINDFLDIQRIESGQQRLQIDDFDLRELLHEQRELFNSGLPGHHFHIRAADQLPRARGDRERTAQVLANLLSNAIKYSPAGGSIELGAQSVGGQLRVAVIDEGVGIPEDRVPLLFRKFYRVDSAANREIGGTGLGLALVKQIVEMQGGTVGVESVLGEGSTFWFTLPVSQEPAIASRSEVVRTTDILLVEDDAAFAELLREHFDTLGLTLVSTAYAERALELTRAAKPRLILIDIYLRGALCGWDLLARLKSDPELHTIPAVVVTISEPNVRGLVLGGAEYISKSAEPDVLRAVIRRHLQGSSGRRVLVVEDDPVFRRRVAEFVVAEGDFQVDEAGDGAEALALMEQRMPDLLLLDLLMPRVDGFEVLRHLRSDSRAVNLRVLVITARNLSLEERLYIRRHMATLIGKREATLDYFTEVVGNTIGFREARDAVEAD